MVRFLLHQTLVFFLVFLTKACLNYIQLKRIQTNIAKIYHKHRTCRSFFHFFTSGTKNYGNTVIFLIFLLFPLFQKNVDIYIFNDFLITSYVISYVQH